MSSSNLSRSEGRAAFSLASIFGLRMLGLFMIYPVFAVYAQGLSGASATTIGLALGIYGLTQALLQIPFGTLSDRIGRKPVIAFGLALFVAGSAVAAMSHSIGGIIIGRALQGGGAVGSAILALNADLTREETRTQAMAIIGMTLGVAFGAAVVLGPLLEAWVGVPGIFWLTAVLGAVGIAVVYAVVPRPPLTVHHSDTGATGAQLKQVMVNGELLRLNFGIFAQHAILTATFLALPIVLGEASSLDSTWYFYLPILVAAFVVMLPFIIIGEKYRKMKPVFIGAVAAVGLSQLSLLFYRANLWTIGAALLVFFAAFSLLESILPSLISKVAPVASKGTAMGVYSSAQFFGIFIGGALGGWLQGLFAPHGLVAVFVFIVVLAAAWLMVAATMPKPRHLSSRLVRVGTVSDAAQSKRVSRDLLAVAGVEDVVVAASEGVAYLKIDPDLLDEAALAAAGANPGDTPDAISAGST